MKKINFSEKKLRELADLEPANGVFACSPDSLPDPQLEESLKKYMEENGTDFLSNMIEKAFKAGYKAGLSSK